MASTSQDDNTAGAAGGSLGAFAEIVGTQAGTQPQDDTEGLLTYQPGQNGGARLTEGVPEGGGTEQTTAGEGTGVRINMVPTVMGETPAEGSGGANDEVAIVASYRAGTLVGKLNRMIAGVPIKDVTKFFTDWVKKGATDGLYQHIIQASDPFCLMVMCEGGGDYLHVIHSTVIYPGKPFVADDPEKGLLTFVNDRIKAADPVAAEITATIFERNIQRKLPKDLEPIKTLVAEGGKKLYEAYHTLDQGVALEEEVNVARAVPVFPQLCIYLLEEQRTPLEAMKWLHEFIEKHSLEADDFEKYLTYLTMAACLDRQRKSKMGIPLVRRVTISESRTNWCAMQLNGTLGYSESQAGQRGANVVAPPRS